MSSYIVRIEITSATIANLITNAVEGGCSSWLGSVDYTGKMRHPPTRQAKFPLADGPAYSQAAFYKSHVWQLAVTHDDGRSSEGSYDIKTIMTPSHVRRGLNKMAKHAPRHFADILNDNDDADTADVFLQFCILGELVFG